MRLADFALKAGGLPLLDFLLCWLAFLMPGLEPEPVELEPELEQGLYQQLELGLELELGSFLAWKSKRVQVLYLVEEPVQEWEAWIVYLVVEQAVVDAVSAPRTVVVALHEREREQQALQTIELVLQEPEGQKQAQGAVVLILEVRIQGLV